MKLFDLSKEKIVEALKNGRIQIAVIGLGRIGLPTACMFAAAGAKVIGVDVNKKLVAEVNSGECRLKDEPGMEGLLATVISQKRFSATCDIFSSVAASDVIIICVPTPVSESKVPQFQPILESCTQIAKSLKRGTLIVIESTVSPGTVENRIVPLIEETSGMKAIRDFSIVSCPERASPGETIAHLKSVPRIVGGIDLNSTKIAAAIYGSALGVQTVEVADPKTANAVKLTENIFRDVNIALMNEFAILYEKLGIDVIEVINTCATKWNFVPHYPGPGVGGPCLPANAYYIIDEGLKVGYIPLLIRLAREINDRMPDHVITLVTEALNNAGKVVSKSRITLLGVSYKSGIHDLQMSPLKHIVNVLKTMGASMSLYDPLFKGEKVFGIKVAKNLNEALHKSDCIIIGTADKEFRNMDLNKVAQICKNPTALVDACNIITPEAAEEHGFVYKGIGRNSRHIIGKKEAKN
jgi:nucleotide sugar dehydrogenase